MLSYTLQRFEKTTTVNIELIDNSFTNRWKDYLVRTIKRLPNLLWSPDKKSMCSNQQINPINHFHELKQSFELLQEHYGTDYSSEISELSHLIENPKDLRQSHLNLWGRHYINSSNDFVTNLETNHLIPQTDTPDNIIFSKIHALNQHTHDLSILTHSIIERREWLKDKVYYGIRSADARNLDDSASLWGNGNQELIVEDFTFDNDYHHTVWIADDIQGKDHFKCWYDEDDASNDDIVGNTFMTPSILIDPHMIFATTMDNPEFKQFVIDSNKPINRYPIGNIVNMDDVNWSVFWKGKLISIELDGKTLWKSS
jgi:hypothetical protein